MARPMKSLTRFYAGSRSGDYNQTHSTQPWLVLQAMFKMRTGDYIEIFTSRVFVFKLGLVSALFSVLSQSRMAKSITRLSYFTHFAYGICQEDYSFAWIARMNELYLKKIPSAKEKENRGRPTKRWMDTVKEDTELRRLKEEDVKDGNNGR